MEVNERALTLVLEAYLDGVFALPPITSTGNLSSSGKSDKVSLVMRLGEADNKNQAVQNSIRRGDGVADVDFILANRRRPRGHEAGHCVPENYL